MEFAGNVLFFVSPYLKPRPNDRNILQHHLQASAERSQNFSTTYRNIVGYKISSAFGHPVATSYDILGIEKRTSAHARVRHCCKKKSGLRGEKLNYNSCTNLLLRKSQNLLFWLLKSSGHQSLPCLFDSCFL